ncbi:MAG: hypothetical protein WAV54_14360 [Acidimicrobiales bacterium]
MIRLGTSFRPNRIAAGLALLTTVAVLAAGCSSSSTSTTTTKPHSSSTTTTAAPSTSTTTTPSGSSSTTTTPSGPSGSALLGKFKSGENATFVATYKFTSSTQELTSLTMARQGSDSLFKGTTSSSNFELITTGGKSYLCMTPSSGSASCYKETGSASSLAGIFDAYSSSTYLPYFQEAASASGGHATYSSKTVNGIPLSCVSVSNAGGNAGTFCVTAQGVLGYVSWSGTTTTDSGSFELESYSTSVPSDEFTLPATPTTIP